MLIFFLGVLGTMVVLTGGIFLISKQICLRLSSSKRQVVIVPSDVPDRYYVRYREKGLLLWGKWSGLCAFGCQKFGAWSYDIARYYADQAMNNGVVPDKYAGFVCPVIEMDEENE